MPRENRKRGRKSKAKSATLAQEDQNNDSVNQFGPENEFQSLSRRDHEGSSEDSPFGALEPDVKAYFRSVDDQLRNWQEETPRRNFEADVDPNEERRIFFTAALSEMNGKELKLATDPDCSPILERMMYSMDDFVRRVFTDRLAGSWLQLITNRFASHVCQTLFTVVAETVTRETRGAIPFPPPSSESRGELLTMTQLILNACEDILPDLPHLIQNVFASHVLRALFRVLAPAQLAPPRSRPSKHVPFARSKKSSLWKARHGPMKPVITDSSQPDGGDPTEIGVPLTPSAFPKTAARFVEKIREALSGNELRALVKDKVASPTLQMLLQLEASIGRADTPGSMMDHALAGFIADTDSTATFSTSPYVKALFLDDTSSHFLESILSCCSSDVFDRFWDCYVRVDLPKLALHPVANFVVACGVGRLDNRRLGDAVAQLESMWNRSFELSRIGVLTAMIERAGKIGAYEAELVEAVCSMSEANTDEERKTIVPCLLQLKTRQKMGFGNETTGEGDRELQDSKKTGISPQSRISLEAKIQGSALLQSLLRLHEPHNYVVLQSLYSLPPTELLALAQNATSSRIFDAALESPTVTLRSRKRLVTAFIGHYHLLSDDRIGSYVADRCWRAADPYLKEKIARSLIPHEQFLAGSHFGRFFTRRLNLVLLQRKPDQWKALQCKDEKPLTNANSITTVRKTRPHPSISEPEAACIPPAPDSRRSLKRKRKDIVGGDEIDMLFSGVGAMKKARGSHETAGETVLPIDDADPALNAVLGAIKAAGSDPRPRRTKE